MATVVRAADARALPAPAALPFEDLAARKNGRSARARIEAARLIARARIEAGSIRRRAAEEGCQAAIEEVERMVAERTAPAVDALRRAAAELTRAKREWLAQWERAAVRLAAAMAARIVRREVRECPEITLSLVREALELAAGSPDVRLHMNPQDCQTLGEETRKIAGAMSALGNVEVTPDESITSGGCRVETRFGAIDQQIDSQLKRILDELLE